MRTGGAATAPRGATEDRAGPPVETLADAGQLLVAAHAPLVEPLLYVALGEPIDGQHLRVPQQGGPGVGGEAAGDLFLAIKLAPHRYFRAAGRDVWLDLPITPWEAALGETVRVPTLGGPVDLRVPKGSGTDRQLRLKGRGLPGTPPGDQFVVLKVMVPPAESAEREALYRQMAASMPFNPRESLEG